MNSFPLITNDLVSACFSNICTLYGGDLVKILHAAQAATSGEPAAFTIIPGVHTNTQIGVIEAKVKKTADGYGQTLLTNILEYLYDDLQASGAIGVTNIDFLDYTKITLQDGSVIQYTASKKWRWIWKLEVDGNPGSVDLDIKTGNAPGAIVPGYILQYIQQGIAAFKSGKHAVAMSLMSIALEGTLRDALHAKGYFYQYGTPTQDVYEVKEMHVHKDASGYKITFPDPMPKADVDYLSAPGDPAYKAYRIKRVKKAKGDFILEIRDVADLMDYWSSDQVKMSGTRNVSGLGAALDIGRNHLHIITPIDIPEDLDTPIQAVRNNLIHLSGTSMTQVVQQDANGKDVTLADFLSNKNRVFDAICTIGNSINTIYSKIADGTL